MTWQLRDPTFRQSIRDIVNAAGDRCTLVGTVGVQIHLALTLGIDKLGPPAHAIELVLPSDPEGTGLMLAGTLSGVPVRIIDALGFEASVQAERAVIEVAGERYPVAAPEHILGLSLAAPDLPPDAKWACFLLMRIYAERLDLEEVRGFLKRCRDPERQALLAELAYLAA